MNPTAVRAGLSIAPVAVVPYVGKISGRKEDVFPVSDELANTISAILTPYFETL